MKKLIVFLAMISILSFDAEALTRKEEGTLILSTALTEHLKRKDCDPLLSFVITTGITALVDLYDNKFKMQNVSLVLGGVLISYTFDEITAFFLEGIKKTEEI